MPLLRLGRPGSFAIVMATGIVSLAAFQQGLRTVSWALLWLNIVLYALLWLIVIYGGIRSPRALFDDLLDVRDAPGLFAVVAATCVLGSQFVALNAQFNVATILWVVAVVLWVLITYAFFTVTIVRTAKPTLDHGIDGMWLLAVVATQAVSYLGGLVAPRFGPGEHISLLFALVLWLTGCMLYIIMITLIVYRLTFFAVTPETLTGPYWISMGALAITTVAGTRLILISHLWGPLRNMIPFLRGFTLFFWAVGTWWIPLLLILGVWRYLIGRYHLRYDPQYWAVVFPLGMYMVCTFDLARATSIGFLLYIPRYGVYLALLAWALTAAGLLGSLRR